MAKYPNWQVGSDVSAANLALGIPNIVVKASNETTSADTTLSNDAELVNIALAVGTHMVCFDLMFYTNTSATPDIKTQWAFTGTWTTPTRMIDGPGASNTAAPTAVTPATLAGVAANVNSVYGTASGTSPYVAREWSNLVVVTVAGNLSLQWAQNTSDASTLTVVAGSTCYNRQIA